MTRTETWTTEVDGMVSTLILDVLDGDLVHVRDDMMDELDLPREREVVEGFVRPQFVWEVRYERVASRLHEKGFDRAE